MKKSFTKTIIRQILSNKSRFVAIFAIVAIGVGFFSGVLASGDDMRLGADQYYDRNNLMDFRLLSTYGFSDSDVAAIGDMSGIKIYPSYFHDLILDTDGAETVCRVFSYNPDNPVNTPYLIAGRLPENENECLLISSQYSEEFLGTKISFSGENGEDIDDVLSQTEYTVVGLFYSPMYISSTQYGSTNIASGKISKIALIPESCFTSKYYTELYVKCDALTELSSYSTEYENCADSISKEIENRLTGRSMVRLDEVRRDAEKELAENKAALADAEQELLNAKIKLADAKSQLDEAKQTLDDAARSIEDGKRELKEQRETYEREIADAEAEIEKARLEIASAEQEYQKNLKKYNEGVAEYERGIAALGLLEYDIERLIAAYGESDSRVIAARAQYVALESTLKESKMVLDRAAVQLRDGKNELDGVITKFNRARRELPQKKEEAETRFAEAEAEIADYEKEYANGLAEYEKALSDYEDANETFLSESAGAEDDIADAKKKIAKAEVDIAELTAPEYFVFDRDSNPAYTEYGQNAERIDNIAKIFPIFFLLVAMLVSLTTMARMVEDDRTQIGAIKALGYTNGAVMKKYMVYAMTATVAGAVVGVMIGFVLFPSVIMSAYGILYLIPYAPTPFVWSIAIPSVLVSVGCILFTVWITVRSYADERPAALMRPSAPPKGKKVWIEKIPALWNMLNFTGKVSARNIFRYKKRMLMTSIGIAGCTALILTGFGLRDSISDIVQLQYNELWHYDAIVVFDDAEDDESLSYIRRTIANFDPNSSDVCVMQKTYTASGKDAKTEIEINLVVPETSVAFDEMVTFRNRKNGERYTLDDSGAVITEKLASRLGISVGDNILVKLSDSRFAQIPVSAVVENYVYHYVYITSDVYQQYTGEMIQPNSMMIRYDIDSEDALTSALLTDENVLSVTKSSSIKDGFSDIMGILNSVVIVLIVSAGALAFVVLYNLTNINISERIREIATLKVLGFREKEVSMYIFRENIVLTLIGSAVGLVLGRFLTDFVVKTAEIDIVMFGRSVSPWSYVIAFLFTLIFSIIASLAMKPKLDKISMTESLKSIE